MDTASAAALAREAGTSVPRVVRAIDRLGIDARQSNGRFALSPGQADRVRRHLGATPKADGLTRSETAVLAALRNAPLGLVSARAVSRRSGVSPTAAGRALESLLGKGLVEKAGEIIAAGRAREVTIWSASRAHPRWAQIEPVLARVRRPDVPSQADDRVPQRLRHLFWNTAETQLDVRRSGPYIARRLLATMDLQGLAWGAQTLEPADWEEGARARGLQPAVKRLALNLAEAPRESRDLDFFFHRPVDLGELSRMIDGLGVFAVTHEGEGALKGLFGATKLEFFDASELTLLAEPKAIAGLYVASLHDLMAMKLKVLAERGEMRDYFDVKAIDERGAISVEEGVELYMRRYGIASNSAVLHHLYRAMGDLSDVEIDEQLPIGLSELQRWWGRRQVQVLRNSSRFG